MVTLPDTKHVRLEVPVEHVLLVTIMRAKQMNSLTVEACWEMDYVWRFLDDEPQLRVGILTGEGEKAFSAGMDLKERTQLSMENDRASMMRYHKYPPTGFGGLTRRVGKKPVIAAVNGHAHGGGFELALNADLVVASVHADFRLPDVLRGTSALEGAFPRLCRTFGLQRANLIALTAYVLSVQEAQAWGLVAQVVEPAQLVPAAVALAKHIASVSPDSVIVSRAGIREAWENASVERSTQITQDMWGEKLMGGKNVMEGMQAFAQKRPPVWKSSKL